MSNSIISINNKKSPNTNVKPLGIKNNDNYFYVKEVTSSESNGPRFTSENKDQKRFSEFSFEASKENNKGVKFDRKVDEQINQVMSSLDKGIDIKKIKEFRKFHGDVFEILDKESVTLEKDIRAIFENRKSIVTNKSRIKEIEVKDGILRLIFDKVEKDTPLDLRTFKGDIEIKKGISYGEVQFGSEVNNVTIRGGIQGNEILDFRKIKGEMKIGGSIQGPIKFGSSMSKLTVMGNMWYEGVSLSKFTGEVEIMGSIYRRVKFGPEIKKLSIGGDISLSSKLSLNFKGELIINGNINAPVKFGADITKLCIWGQISADSILDFRNFKGEIELHKSTCKKLDKSTFENKRIDFSNATKVTIRLRNPTKPRLEKEKEEEEEETIGYHDQLDYCFLKELVIDGDIDKDEVGIDNIEKLTITGGIGNKRLYLSHRNIKVIEIRKYISGGVSLGPATSKLSIGGTIMPDGWLHLYRFKGEIDIKGSVLGEVISCAGITKLSIGENIRSNINLSECKGEIEIKGNIDSKVNFGPHITKLSIGGGIGTNGEISLSEFKGELEIKGDIDGKVKFGSHITKLSISGGIGPDADLDLSEFKGELEIQESIFGKIVFGPHITKVTISGSVGLNAEVNLSQCKGEVAILGSIFGKVICGCELAKLLIGGSITPKAEVDLSQLKGPVEIKGSINGKVIFGSGISKLLIGGDIANDVDLDLSEFCGKVEINGYIFGKVKFGSEIVKLTIGGDIGSKEGLNFSQFKGELEIKGSILMGKIIFGSEITKLLIGGDIKRIAEVDLSEFKGEIEIDCAIGDNLTFGPQVKKVIIPSLLDLYENEEVPGTLLKIFQNQEQRKIFFNLKGYIERELSGIIDLKIFNQIVNLSILKSDVNTSKMEENSIFIEIKKQLKLKNIPPQNSQIN